MVRNITSHRSHPWELNTFFSVVKCHVIFLGDNPETCELNPYDTKVCIIKHWHIERQKRFVDFFLYFVYNLLLCCCCCTGFYSNEEENCEVFARKLCSFRKRLHLALMQKDTANGLTFNKRSQCNQTKKKRATSI